MSLTYTTYISQISNLLVIPSTQAEFQIMAPGMIDYAEQRIYREGDLLHTQVTDATASVSSGVRDLILPTTTGTYIIVDNINVITPVTSLSSNGTRNQLTMTSREFLDVSYPSGQTVTGVPEFWAMASDTEVILGPAPDAAYHVEIVGIQRPTPLSSSNTTTILTTYCPDLFIAASMVFASGYQRDFAAQGDNPQMGASWEGQYTKLFQSMDMEQSRAKGESEGWTTNSPSKIATPKRV